MRVRRFAVGRDQDDVEVLGRVDRSHHEAAVPVVGDERLRMRRLGGLDQIECL
ncbi:MAG: hypothetical protein ACXVEF_40910 [Polyangiales bacterium]